MVLPTPTTTVLFDLDDTLFDHGGAVRALAATVAGRPALHTVAP